MTLVFEGVSKVVNGQTPDYPKLAQLWWQNIGDASSGAKSVKRPWTASVLNRKRS